MTGKDLIIARSKLTSPGRGRVQAMADKLETPKRTYQGWEARKGQIPGIASVAVSALLKLATAQANTPEKAVTE